MKEEGYDPTADYCTLFPDKMLGVNYNYGCYLHDRHYRNERKRRLSRKDADKLLFKQVFLAYSKRKMYSFGLIWASLMYLGVRLFARKAYVEE